MVETMNEQLLLLRPDERPWRLDDHTRHVGREGVEQARAALRQVAAAKAPATRPSPRRRLTTAA